MLKIYVHKIIFAGHVAYKIFIITYWYSGNLTALKPKTTCTCAHTKTHIPNDHNSIIDVPYLLVSGCFAVRVTKCFYHLLCT